MARPRCRLRSIASAAALLAAVAGPLTGVGRADEDGPPLDASSAIHVRYAEARLDLARLDLERAIEADESAGGRGVSETDLRRLRARIRVLESQLEATRAAPHGNGIESQKARARIAAEVAEEDLRSAEEIRERMPAAFPEIDLRRARKRVEIARLRVDLLEDPENVPSLIDQMQLQIDQLTDHVLDLLDAVEQRNRTVIPGERR